MLPSHMLCPVTIIICVVFLFLFCHLPYTIHKEMLYAVFFSLSVQFMKSSDVWLILVGKDSGCLFLRIRRAKLIIEKKKKSKQQSITLQHVFIVSLLQCRRYHSNFNTLRYVLQQFSHQVHLPDLLPLEIKWCLPRRPRSPRLWFSFHSPEEW